MSTPTGNPFGHKKGACPSGNPDCTGCNPAATRGEPAPVTLGASEYAFEFTDGNGVRHAVEHDGTRLRLDARGRLHSTTRAAEITQHENPALRHHTYWVDGRKVAEHVAYRPPLVFAPPTWEEHFRDQNANIHVTYGDEVEDGDGTLLLRDAYRVTSDWHDNGSAVERSKSLFSDGAGRYTREAKKALARWLEDGPRRVSVNFGGEYVAVEAARTESDWLVTTSGDRIDLTRTTSINRV